MKAPKKTPAKKGRKSRASQGLAPLEARTIRFQPEALERFDKLRGELSRTKFIDAMMDYWEGVDKE